MKTPCCPPVCALTGPTASGKSALAMAVAQAQGRELVSVDSVQAYRGFDIGSAKPSRAERAQVPHHLVDVCAWSSPLDAARWAAMAKEAIADARRRGRGVLLVGGTGLYLRALGRGLISVPTCPALRAQLLARADGCAEALWHRLLALDPMTARALAPQNGAHVLRALEITLLCGEPASAVRARQRQAQSAQPQVHLLAVQRPDALLRGRIAARCRAMLEAGLVTEVQGLLAQGVAPDCQPMRAIGYREVVRALSEGWAADSARLGAAIDNATWQYVRRQRTWLRREASQGEVASLPWEEEAIDAVVPRVVRWLANAEGPLPKGR